MAAEMKAQDAELAGLLAKLNAAPKDQKIDPLVAIVTRMVQQRATMHQHMTKMHEDMMQSMNADKDAAPPTTPTKEMPPKTTPEAPGTK
jgi:hypothetical protein